MRFWSGSVSPCGLETSDRRLTAAVIVLIAAEILVAAINIVVDVLAGAD